MRSIIIVSSFFLIVQSCGSFDFFTNDDGKSTDSDASKEITGTDDPTSNSSTPSIKVLDLSSVDLKIDDYTLKSVNVIEKVISIEVEYVGGCSDHEFMLYADTNVYNPILPQVPIVLSHNSNDESCSKTVSETLDFNLSILTSIELFRNANSLVNDAWDDDFRVVEYNQEN